MTRVLVVGAGATGGYFGARLHAAGRDVTFLLRPRRAAQVRENGLRLTGAGEPETVTPRVVTADALSGPYGIVLLSVKAAGLRPALEDLAPAVGPDTVIVPFLNGMAHLDVLNGRFGAAAVLGGVVKVVAKLGPDGEIVRLARSAGMAVGEQDGRDTPRLRAVAAALGGAGYDFATPPDILAAMWHKWVFIATLTAVTCLLSGTVGEVAAVPGGPAFATAVLGEAAAVSAAAGFPLPAAERDGVLATATTEGSPFAPSMYRDLVQGLPTEVEHVLADLTARARHFGVGTPLLDLATARLRVHQNRVAG
ncbi:2-dehydropantoate 2-reductase [Streptomyces sp. SL13]|uniref:2-dehydropantoate 2-reductase n=1 Tax=Streptantibioticus silvisoli TaxID=2705255 RepID=A0AA90GWC4_9ACTN|nr:2-dehydropantoate 2-reductase [Streptantibioticus silvisoli]MDI5969069.1 2-dehydropantoate 2-reductase [Streptantibioticus silvisoli]